MNSVTGLFTSPPLPSHLSYGVTFSACSVLAFGNGKAEGNAWSRLPPSSPRSDLIIRAAPIGESCSACGGRDARRNRFLVAFVIRACIVIRAERERLSSALAPVIWIHSIGLLCLTRMERPDARHVCSPGSTYVRKLFVASFSCSDRRAFSFYYFICLVLCCFSLRARQALCHGKVLKAGSGPSVFSPALDVPNVTGVGRRDALAPLFI